MKNILTIAIISIMALCACENETYVDHSFQGTVNQTSNPDAPAINEAVDLGLSVKWAPYNIGAKQAHEYGNYYAYGETSTKDSYSNDNYSAPTNKNSFGNIISTDSDVATKAWGKNWRMPSSEEIAELRKCNWEETEINGVKGLKITSRTNGNSIFLPAAGIYTDNKLYEHNNKGFYRSGDNRRADFDYFTNPDGDHYGFSVRAVLSAAGEQTSNITIPEENEAIDLGLSTKWAPYNIGASNAYGFGNYYAFGELEPKTNYTKENYTEPTEFNCEGGIEMSNSDVATVKWGKNWKMPSAADINELFERCTIRLTKYEGILGYEFEGPNGNTMFLPFGGFMDDYKPSEKGMEAFHYWNSDFNLESQEKYRGLPVRPVLITKVPQNKTFPAPAPEESVDLGLSVNWAPYNVGATTETETGNYYAWGETEFKDSYCEHNYTAPVEMNSRGGISGTKHDVAHVKWGNGWRMPTEDEINELWTKCEWSTQEVNGVKGISIKAINGNSIFLPFGGTLDYNGLNEENIEGYYRKDLSDKINCKLYYFDNRFIGALVRPVIDNDNLNDDDDVSNIDLVNVKTDNHSDFNYYRLEIGGAKGEMYMDFDLSITLNENLSENSFADYGIILYRGEREIAKISKSMEGYYDFSEQCAVNVDNNQYNAFGMSHIGEVVLYNQSRMQENYVAKPAQSYLRIRLKADHNDFFYFYDNMYIASATKSFKYKTYFTKEDINGIMTETVLDDLKPFELNYIQQPSMRMGLENVTVTHYGDNSINVDHHHNFNMTGMLFVDTLYLVRAECDIEDVYDVSTYKFNKKNIETFIWQHDGGCGYLTNFSFNKGEYTSYKLMYGECILKKGNDIDTLRSNPILIDYSKEDESIMTVPEIPGWPEKVNFGITEINRK